MKHDPNVADPRTPWKVSFGVGIVYLGCLFAGVAFTALTFVWVWLVVPAEVLAETDPPISVAQLALVLGGFATALLLIAGPGLALALGWMLRNVANQWTHILVFTSTGALLGGLVGALLGPDMVLILTPTMGTAVGLARLMVSRFARTWPPRAPGAPGT